MAATVVRPDSLRKRRETKLERDLRGYKDGDQFSIVNNTFGIQGLTDNTAATILTVVMPNVNIAAGMDLTVVGGLGDQDSAEISYWTIALSRIAGAASKITLSSKGSNVNTSGATANAAVTVSNVAVAGANSATQTFAIQVKVARSAGSSDTHDVVAFVDMFNVRAGGAFLQ